MPAKRKHATPAMRQAAYRKRREEARMAEQREKGLPELPAIKTLPGERRWSAMLEMARRLLETVVEEREQYFDDRSQAWQDSEPGADFQDRTAAVADALGEMEASAT
jgi:hypothetical protein